MKMFRSGRECFEDEDAIVDFVDVVIKMDKLSNVGFDSLYICKEEGTDYYVSIA